jgi:hypothetical protein
MHMFKIFFGAIVVNPHYTIYSSSPLFNPTALAFAPSVYSNLTLNTWLS